MRCSELVAAYLAELPLGNVLTEGQVTRHLKNAIRFYCGYATLVHAPSAFEQLQAQERVAEAAHRALPPPVIVPVTDFLSYALKGVEDRCDPEPQVSQWPAPGTEVHTPIDATNGFSGSQDFDLTPSEYALIWPLFRLYIELENATALESSRGMGAEIYGRTTGEIQVEIGQVEERMERLAYRFEVITIE